MVNEKGSKQKNKKPIIPQKIITKFDNNLRLMERMFINFSSLFLLSRPSSLSDNISINKSTFIIATNKNMYLQLMFRNKMPLTKTGAIKAPIRYPISNLIIALLLFSSKVSLIIETEIIEIIPQDIPNTI